MEYISLNIFNRINKYLTLKESNSCDRMKIIKLEYQENTELFNRSKLDAEGVMDTVKGIISAVKEDGDIALRQYTKKFDSVDLNLIRVDEDVIDNSLANLDD